MPYPFTTVALILRTMPITWWAGRLSERGGYFHYAGHKWSELISYSITPGPPPTHTHTAVFVFRNKFPAFFFFLEFFDVVYCCIAPRRSVSCSMKHWTVTSRVQGRCTETDLRSKNFRTAADSEFCLRHQAGRSDLRRKNMRQLITARCVALILVSEVLQSVLLRQGSNSPYTRIRDENLQ
jgi:hypothetical protein